MSDSKRLLGKEMLVPLLWCGWGHVLLGGVDGVMFYLVVWMGSCSTWWCGWGHVLLGDVAESWPWVILRGYLVVGCVYVEGSFLMAVCVVVVYQYSACDAVL